MGLGSLLGCDDVGTAYSFDKASMTGEYLIQGKVYNQQFG